MSKVPDKRRLVKSAAKVLKTAPAFGSEAEERQFWETHDSTEYVDCGQAQRVRLKPTSKSISLRLPRGLLDALRIEANRRDVPY